MVTETKRSRYEGGDDMPLRQRSVQPLLEGQEATSNAACVLFLN